MDEITPPLSQQEEHHRHLSEEEKKRLLIELLHFFLKLSKKQPQASTKDEEKWRKKWINAGGAEKGCSLSTTFSTSYPAAPSLLFSPSRSAAKNIPKDILQMASSLIPIKNFVGFTEDIFHRLQYDERAPSSFHHSPHHHRRRHPHHRTSSTWFTPASSSTVSHGIKKSKANDSSTSEVERELSSPDTNLELPKENTMLQEEKKKIGAHSLHLSNNDVDAPISTHARGEGRETKKKCSDKRNESKRRAKRILLSVDTLRQKEEKTGLPLTKKENNSRVDSASSGRSHSWRRCVCCSGRCTAENHCDGCPEKKKISSPSSSPTRHRPFSRRRQKESHPPTVGFVDTFRNRVRGTGPAFMPCFGSSCPPPQFSVTKTGGTAFSGSEAFLTIPNGTHFSSPIRGGSRRPSWSTKKGIERKRGEQINSSTEETFFDAAFTLEGFMGPLRRQYNALAKGKRKESISRVPSDRRSAPSALTHTDHETTEEKEESTLWRAADEEACTREEEEDEARWLCRTMDHDATTGKNRDEKAGGEGSMRHSSFNAAHSKAVSFSKSLSVHSGKNEQETDEIHIGGVSSSDALQRDVVGSSPSREGESEGETAALSEELPLRKKWEKGGVENRKSSGSSLRNGEKMCAPHASGKCRGHLPSSTSDSSGFGEKIPCAATMTKALRPSVPPKTPSTLTSHAHTSVRAGPYGRTGLEKETVIRKGKRRMILSQPQSKTVGKQKNRTLGTPKDIKATPEEGFLTSVHSSVEIEVVEKVDPSTAVVGGSTTVFAEEPPVWKDYDPEKAALWMIEREGELDFLHAECSEAPHFAIPSTTERKHITPLRIFVPSRSIAFSAFFVGILEGAWHVQDDSRGHLEHAEKHERHEIERRRIASSEQICRDKLERLWFFTWMSAFGSVALVIAESFLWSHVKAAHNALRHEEEKAWSLLVKEMYQYQCHYFHSLLLLQKETISSLHGQLTDAQSSLALAIKERIEEVERNGEEKTTPPHRSEATQGQEQLHALPQKLETVPNSALERSDFVQEEQETGCQESFLPPEEKQIILSESAISATRGIEAEEMHKRVFLEVIPAAVLVGETFSQTDGSFSEVPRACLEQEEDHNTPPERILKSDEGIVPLEIRKYVAAENELSVSGSPQHPELLMSYNI